MSAFRSLGSAALALAALALLAACGDDAKEPLPGERISVLSLQRTLAPDPDTASLVVRLPAPQPNRDWPQSGGYPSHAMHHLAARDELGIAWAANIGTAASSAAPILNPPVTGEGRVFTVDADGRVSAFEAATGRRLWRIELTPEEEKRSAFSGGLGFAGGRLFVTTGAGQVVALDAAKGTVLWRHAVGVPMRAAPTIAGGRVFVVTYDNQIYALSAADGSDLWSYQAITESTGFVGGASPAVEGGTVIAPFSSGELAALAVESGRAVWQDTLALETRTGGFRTLTDIKGDPVIDRGVVYASGHSGFLAAIDMRTGERIWEQDISGLQMPWIAGDFLYMLTSDGELVCLTAKQGSIRWVTPLPRWEDPEDRDDPIYWAGPLLVSDRLIVTGTNGVALAVSPYTGKILGGIELPAPTHLPPVAANGTVYILTDEAELVALR